MEAATSTMPHYNPAFGAAIKKALSDRGLTTRTQRPLTDINHVTVSDMTHGYVPRPETIAQFARGLGLPVQDLLRLAGYEPLAEESAADRLVRGLLELQERYAAAELRLNLPAGASVLTVEEAEAILASVEEQLQGHHGKGPAG